MPAWSLAFLASALVPRPPVIVEVTTDCPSRDAIVQELDRIISAPPGSEPTDRALVAREGSELYIVLEAANGQRLGERRLLAAGSCEERALSVAVVLGAWIASVHPEYLSALPEAEAEAEAPRTTDPPPPAAPAIRTPPPPAPTPAWRPERATTPAAAPPVAWRFEAALAGGGELSGAGLVPALEGSARYTPEGSGVGLGAFVLVALPEERGVGAGRVSSFRWPLGAAVVGRLAFGGAALELEAGPMFALLGLQGRGFARDDAAIDFQGGAHAGLRVGASSGALRPFAATRLLTWFGGVTASARLPDAEVDLPVTEALFLAGFAVVP